MPNRQKKAGWRRERRIAFFFAAGSFFLILAGFTADRLLSPSGQAEPTGPEIQAEFSGFETGATISYSLIPRTGRPVNGASLIDETGQAQMPAAYFEDAESPNLTYDLTIDDSQRTLSVLMNFNRETGRLSLQGRGAAPFEKIALDVGGRKTSLHSDWAGLFLGTDLDLSRQDQKQAGEQEIRLAFGNVYSANDAWPGQNASVVKIIYAPGGGQLDGTGLNIFNPMPFCGSPPLSICDLPAMQTQIADMIENLINPLFPMAEQLTVAIAQQTPIIGKFIDAKEQMDAMREMQKLKAIAVKDYHPSEQVCRIGSFIRSLPSAEMKSLSDRLAMSDALMERYTNASSNSAGHNVDSDIENRLQQFRTIYCDPADNNNGLRGLCEHDQDGDYSNSTNQIGATNKRRVNKDIDFIRTLESAYTLDIDFSDNVMSDDEQDVIALARNLYWPDPYKIILQGSIKNEERDYLKSRRIMAMKNVAHNSFATLVGMKARAPDAPTGVQPGWSHMKTMLREFGMTDQAIDELVGERPSYYAQMDMLTKKAFQNPNFYTNLYDKPVNVSRIGASLTAIKIMQTRDHYEAALRREMLLSALVEENLTSKAEKTQGQMNE